MKEFAEGTYKICGSIVESGDIALISKCLEVDCEIYDITDGEKHLGVLSRRSLVLLFVEMTDYIIKEVAKEKDSMIEDYMRILRSWLENEDYCFSSYDREAIKQSTDNIPKPSDSNIKLFLAHYYIRRALSFYARGVDYWVRQFLHVYAEAFGALSIYDELEVIFSCNVISFLKSGKHLFMV
jgi:hypothetical protein